jgi:putative DNA primase/helicase
VAACQGGAGFLMVQTSGLDQFRQALAARSIIPPAEIVADGRMHRAAVEGARRGRADASYLVHPDGPVAAGGFENHKDGLGWQPWRANLDRRLNASEQAALKRRTTAIRAQREADVQERQATAAKRAESLWNAARPASNSHPYLLRKAVGAFGLRALREQLVIPLRDSSGRLWTLQFISPDGAKRFLTGGRKQGCYFSIGRPVSTLCIAEGYATAASIFQATGHATAAAMDAGNLVHVAKALRAKFPELRLILAADNDVATPGNPGLTKAQEAARAVRGLVAYPVFDERAGA